jgi:hypothetical protein
MTYGTCVRGLLAVFAIGIFQAMAQTPPAADKPKEEQKPAEPAPPAAPAPPTWSIGPIDFSGLIDTYADINFNHPESKLNQYRNFDVKANQFTLNMGKFTLNHDPDPVGFRLDFGFGRAFDIINATEPGGPEFLKYIPQAFVEFKPKQLKGTQFDFGKFYTSAGAEVTETHLNWNYSRALLYANGPYYHFGLRVTQPLFKDFAAGFQVVNGWNNVEDNNSGKTFGITTALTKKKFSWFNNYYVGPENYNTNTGYRNFYDGVLLLTPTDKFNAYVNYDYGVNKYPTGVGGANFQGIALAARFQATSHISFAPRWEYYYDKSGFITGTAQKLKEFTITAEYKWLEGLLTRLEYRRDYSNQPVFDRGSTVASYKNQDTVLIGLVGYFGPKR